MENLTFFKDVINIFKKYLILLVAFVIVGGLLGRVAANYGPEPTYEASTSLILDKKMEQTNIIINQSEEYGRFFNTAQALVDTSSILDPVITELNLKENAKKLAEKITASNENVSKMIKITVSYNDDKKATDIANAVTDVFVSNVKNYLDVESVKIVQKAEYGQETKVLHTRTNANIVMGMIIGLIVGTILAFLLNHFTSRVKKA